jgi:glycosyltransferase involved in cell wall biosynthesis
MRVLQLGPYARPHGGVQAHVVSLRQFLLPRGIPCAVINVTRFRDDPADEVYYPRSAPELFWLLLRLRYDVLHLHIGGTLPGRLLGLGMVCCLLPWAKTVLTFHSGGYPSSTEGRSAHPRTLRGFVLRRFDRLIGVNAELVELYHRLGCSPDRIRLIEPHAFLAQQAAPSNPLPLRLRQFREAHAPVLLTVGQLEPEYDLPLQIDVLARIRDVYPNAGLAIIGAGSLEEELRERIRAAPHGEHVLLCGDVAHAGTLRAIAESDLLLRTTWYDGDSIAVREGLHLGVPVVATDNGMRPPGVRLVPQGCLSSLQNAIEEVLAAPPAPRPRTGEADERNLEAVLAVYRELTE